MEVLEELLAASFIAGADSGAEGACARVATQIGFREEEQLDSLTGSFVRSLGEGGEGGGCGWKGAGLGDGNGELLRHTLSCLR